ncbi:MAG: A/G-specific adenine glycosylase [Desulfovibrionaceae bacterium]|nr:A/G-specific adenine glycosylase [Desulfovibrionaceae bacterium]
MSGWFCARVIGWQQRHGRHGLPWQATRDPYRVWLSEVMLQQTQVATALDYYRRFLARFPDLASLAAAHQDEVLALWSGLGYYSRARNLHACARQVTARPGGGFPRTAAELQRLPGIGPSTAAAIAAFCFGERAAILDGNVKRVLTRAFGIGDDLRIAAHVRALQQRAESLLPTRDIEQAMPIYTQGLMDLGATVCTLRRPACATCPLAGRCVAARQGQPERYPVNTRRLRRGQQALWLLHAVDDRGQLWLARRPATGIWARLHCLPQYGSSGELMQDLPAPARATAAAHPPFAHALTHRDLEIHVISARLPAATPLAGEGRWHAPAAWPALGLPAPVRRFLERQAATPFDQAMPKGVTK